MKNIVETAIEAGIFKSLIKAVQKADLVDTLSGSDNFTVFAPNDKAFSKLPAGTLENLLNDKEKLTEMLTYHVITDRLRSSDVSKIKNARTVNGAELSIDTSTGFKINNANVIEKDIECSNGVIHILDSVLMPK